MDSLTKKAACHRSQISVSTIPSCYVKIRVGKTGSVLPWRKVIGYCRSVRIIAKAITYDDRPFLKRDA